MKLTPLQRVEVMAWYKARKALGTFKSKAREMGVTPQTITACVFSMREQEREYVRKRDREADARRKLRAKVPYLKGVDFRRVPV
jgi:DNA-binding MarR family transcriptional regulator